VPYAVFSGTTTMSDAAASPEDQTLYSEVLDAVKIRNTWQRKEDWDGYALAQGFLSITDPFFELAYGEYSGKFDACIIGVIMTAGIMVGVQVLTICAPMPPLCQALSVPAFACFISTSAITRAPTSPRSIGFRAI